MSDKNKKKSVINRELALEGNVIEAKYFFSDTRSRNPVSLTKIPYFFGHKGLLTFLVCDRDFILFMNIREKLTLKILAKLIFELFRFIFKSK